MADPLSSTAATMAPPRASTKFFDPRDANDIYNHYSTRGIGRDELDYAAGEADKLVSLRTGLARERRAQLSLDREDEDYNDKKQWKVARGEFLTGLAGLDPEADDYETRKSEIIATLPYEAKSDDAVRDIIASKDMVWTRRQMENERKRDRDEMRTRQERAVVFRATQDGLTPEEIEELRDPETGELDVYAIANKGGERKREIANKENDRRAERTQNNRLELKRERDMTTGQKELFKTVKQHIADQVAFPTQSSSLLENDKNAATTKPVEWAAAQEWDRRQLDSELEAARNTPTVEAYVNKAGNGGKNLTPVQRKKREDLWKLANSGIYEGGETPEPGQPAPATPAPAKPAPAAAEPPKVVRKKEIQGVSYGQTEDGRWIRL